MVVGGEPATAGEEFSSAGNGGLTIRCSCWTCRSLTSATVGNGSLTRSRSTSMARD